MIPTVSIDKRKITDSEIYTPDNSNTQVGDYILENIIGQGQFASVKKGKKIGEEEYRAIKYFDKSKINSFKSLLYITNEIKNIKLLKSEYIMNVHDIFHNETFLYIVLDYGPKDLYHLLDTYQND